MRHTGRLQAFLFILERFPRRVPAPVLWSPVRIGAASLNSDPWGPPIRVVTAPRAGSHGAQPREASGDSHAAACPGMEASYGCGHIAHGCLVVVWSARTDITTRFRHRSRACPTCQRVLAAQKTFEPVRLFSETFAARHLMQRNGGMRKLLVVFDGQHSAAAVTHPVVNLAPARSIVAWCPRSRPAMKYACRHSQQARISALTGTRPASRSRY